ncbi:MAG: ABC transporter permease [Actinomycetes bacterium]
MIDFLGQVWDWFGDPANWTGNRGLPGLLRSHVFLSAVSVATAAVVALPVAVWLGHTRRGGALAVSLVNVGRAIPSFGLIGVFFPLTLMFEPTSRPLGFWATFIAMVALAMPPMFVNAYTGIREIDPALTEAARGMGMTGRQVLTGVELPLALPLVMAGIRNAAVAVVATVTLSAWVGCSSLGTYVFVGFAQRDRVMVFAGGLAVALLSIVTELTLGGVERLVDPLRPMRRRRR